MSLMRYITPTLDHMCEYFDLVQGSTLTVLVMDSLQWVDQTYVQKHQGEDPKNLRALFYPNLRLYATHGDTSKQKAPMDAAIAFLTRFGRRAAISLVIYMLSYLPIVGRFVLPAASFYTFNKAVGPLPATVIFGSGIFLPRRYLVLFLQSYFSSRSLMRELVCICGLHPTWATQADSDSLSPTFRESISTNGRSAYGFVIARVSYLGRSLAQANRSYRASVFGT